MSNHTPGPWAIFSFTEKEGFCISSEKEGGCIAERWLPSPSDTVPLEANARLISAAPELLATVKLFGARVMERCPSWFDELPGSTDFAEANEKLKAAIAKAEGR